MQQKYIYEHSLSSNLINNKLREEMYLKHLRQVQKINNRQAESLKKQLKNYRSISQIHKQNKVKAFQFKLKQQMRNIQEKNLKIHSKIQSISSNDVIKINTKQKSNSLHITRQSDNNQQKNSVSVSISPEKTPSKLKAKQSFHYRYRKRQQQHIEQQNVKLMKAILSQRSTILPKIKQNRMRASSQLSKTRDINKSMNDDAL